MRLTFKNLHYFLVDNGLIETSSIIDGDYEVSQLTTRNVIFNIKRQKGQSLFVKQLDKSEHQDKYVLQKDATCLWLIKNEKAYKKLSKFVPEYRGYKTEFQVLVTDYIEHSQNLYEYRLKNKTFSSRLIKKLAVIFAAYHFKVDDNLLSHHSVRFFSRHFPWVLNIPDFPVEQYDTLLTNTSQPNPALLSISSHLYLKQYLGELRKIWVYDTLIHGDIKWTNILIQSKENKEKPYIIDWELADIGDPLWDIAGVIAGFISEVILFSQPQAYSQLTHIKLEDMASAVPYVDEFWRTYAQKMKFSKATALANLEKTLRLSGARLAQTSIENSVSHTQLHPDSLKLLQGANVLLSEYAKAVDFFTVKGES